MLYKDHNQYLAGFYIRPDLGLNFSFTLLVMLRSFLSVLFAFVALTSSAGNKIKYYFTQPVNTGVSKGEHAQYLNNAMGDTIVAYINRAKFTIDIAVYNYTSSFPAIAVAANNAHNRGVKVRWIYDSNSSNTGLSLLNAAINKLASPPNAGNYTIMHNKFMVIDALSTNPEDAIVWTGSTNWNTQQFNSDYNNAVVIQDQAVAQAFRDHFNMMWGGSGIAPNTSASKFGQYKTDLGAHTFTVDGKRVEVYFSPADGTNSKILGAMLSANTDMYFGMSTFTLDDNAVQLVSKFNTGVYVAGISDQSGTGSSVSSILTSGLGSNYEEYTTGGLYHNKFLIVDASNSCSDPLIVTGSHNWSYNANTKNDENTIIIYDKTAANIFYQSFHADYTSLGGTLTAITDCPAGVSATAATTTEVLVYPNPSNGQNINVRYTLEQQQAITIEVLDISGAVTIVSPTKTNAHKGENNATLNVSGHGIFILKLTTENGVFRQLIHLN